MQKDSSKTRTIELGAGAVKQPVLPPAHTKGGTLPKMVEIHLDNCFSRYMEFMREHVGSDAERHDMFLSIHAEWDQWVKRQHVFLDYDKYNYLFALRVYRVFPTAMQEAIDYHDEKQAALNKKDVEADEDFGVIATNSIEPSVDERLNNLGLIRG